MDARQRFIFSQFWRWTLILVERLNNGALLLLERPLHSEFVYEDVLAGNIPCDCQVKGLGRRSGLRERTLR